MAGQVVWPHKRVCNIKPVSQDAQQVEATQRLAGQVVWPHERAYNIKPVSQDAQQVEAAQRPQQAEASKTPHG